MNSIMQSSGLEVAFDGEAVLVDFNLDLAPGEIGCLLGPSGCGKTSLLRAIAGFQTPSAGAIHISGRLVSDTSWMLPPEKRAVGMVFQDFALFPHLNVTDNVGFGLRRMPGRAGRVSELLELVGLPETAKRYPHELSGGQQQRIALARALAPRPVLLLMDEPFSSLDIELRESLASEVRDILKEEGISSLLVTHDQHEAFAIADRVGVMREGRLLQWDTPYNLYHEPAERFVADFIGQGTLLSGEVLNDGSVSTELAVLRGRVPAGCGPGCHVDVLVRPDDIVHDDDSAMTATITDRAFRGSHFLYTLQLDSGARIMCLAPSHHAHDHGQRVGIRLDLDHLVVFGCRDRHQNDDQ